MLKAFNLVDFVMRIITREARGTPKGKPAIMMFIPVKVAMGKNPGFEMGFGRAEINKFKPVRMHFTLEATSMILGCVGATFVAVDKRAVGGISHSEYFVI